MVTHPPRYQSEMSHSPRVSPQNPLPPLGSLFPLLQSSPTNKRDTSGILFIDLVPVKDLNSSSLSLSVCPSLSLSQSLSPPVVSCVLFSAIFFIFLVFLFSFFFFFNYRKFNTANCTRDCRVRSSTLSLAGSCKLSA